MSVVGCRTDRFPTLRLGLGVYPSGANHCLDGLQENRAAQSHTFVRVQFFIFHRMTLGVALVAHGFKPDG